MNIPNKNKSEWHELLSGNRKISLNSFVLKVKLVEVQEQLSKNTISTDNAIAELYDVCVKYHKSDNIVADIIAIFGENIVNTSENTILPTDSAIEKGNPSIVLEETKNDNASVSLDPELEALQNRLDETLLEKEKIEKKLKSELENRFNLFERHQKELKLAESNLNKYKTENDTLKLQLKTVLIELKEAKEGAKLDFDMPKNKKPFMKGVWDMLSDS